jgi:predicted ArsR family transcriptional regulator
MRSTKSEILAVLKRTDGSTVDELAASLGLASMTVRQHLTALARDALIDAAEVRRATGRPHYLYRLTEDGHRSVASGFDRMLALIVEQAGDVADGVLDDLEPDDRRARLFRLAAQRLAARHRAEVAALSAARQVERVVAILQSYGGFAEVHARGSAFELRDFSCVYRSLVCRSGACEWHETLLRGLLGDVVHDADGDADCADCCRYEITTGRGRP